MQTEPLLLTVLVAAYCLGSISFAIAVSWLMGLPDPRSYGSKNPGTTNVLRTGRTAAAVLTLLGDAGKGALAVWLASFFTDALAAVGLAAFLGHLFPVYHRFQGGKGVATAGGVLFALASLVAALFAPFATALLLGWQSAVIVGVMTLLLFWRHRGNIARLLAGTESRLGEKKARPSGPSAA